MSQILPQAIDAETAVLGAVLLDPKCIVDVKAVIKSSDFYKTAHITIFKAMCVLDEKEIQIDIQTLCDELKKQKKLDKVGGAYYLTGLYDSVPSSANVGQHCRIVKEKSELRRLIQLGQKIQTEAFEGIKTIDEITDEISSELVKVSSNDEFRSIIEVMHEINDDIDYKIQNPGISGFKSGIHKIDDLLTGYHPGELYIIAGRPSMGKSTFARNIILKSCFKDLKKTLVFSLEEMIHLIMSKILCGMAKVSLPKLRTGRFNQDELKRFQEAEATIKNNKYPLFIDDNSGINTHYIHSKAKRAIQKFGLDLIIIDHIQLIRCRAENRNRELGIITDELKRLAKELKIPVIALCQLRRLSDSVRRPRLDDLRESGDIEQNADVVHLIHRWDYYGVNEYDGKDTKGLAEHKIAKNRNGPTDTIISKFVSEYALFENECKK